MEEKGWFSDKEHEEMIRAVAGGQDSFTQEDVEKLLDWIVKVNVDKTFADMVLAGKLLVDVRGDEFAFKKREKE